MPWGYYGDEAARLAANPWTHGDTSPTGAPGYKSGAPGTSDHGNANMAWSPRDWSRAYAALQAGLGGGQAALQSISGNKAGVESGLAQQTAGTNTVRNIENAIALDRQADQAESAKNHGNWLKTSGFGQTLGSLLKTAGPVVGSFFGPIGAAVGLGAGMLTGGLVDSASGGNGSTSYSSYSPGSTGFNISSNIPKLENGDDLYAAIQKYLSDRQTKNNTLAILEDAGIAKALDGYYAPSATPNPATQIVDPQGLTGLRDLINRSVQ